MPHPEPKKRCLGCAYILDGLPENRCPECGQPFDPDDPTTFNTSVLSGRLLLAAAVFCGLATAVGPIIAKLSDLGLLRLWDHGWAEYSLLVLCPCLIAGGLGFSVVIIKTCADALAYHRHEVRARKSFSAAIVVSSLTVVAWLAAFIAQLF